MFQSCVCVVSLDENLKTLEHTGTNQSYISKQRMSNTAIETGGFKTPMASANETLGSKSVLMSGLSQAREQLITGTLDKMSDSVTGQTVVDPKGYLTSMNSIAPVTANADINDIKKARLLMKSVTQTNPKHAPGWIAYVSSHSSEHTLFFLISHLEQQVRTSRGVGWTYDASQKTDSTGL